MGDHCEHTQNQPKAVEQGRRAAQNVKRREVHAITDETRVINQIAAEELAMFSKRIVVHGAHTDVSTLQL